MREKRGVNNERAAQRFVSRKLCGSSLVRSKSAAEFETAGLRVTVLPGSEPTQIETKPKRGARSRPVAPAAPRVPRFLPSAITREESGCRFPITRPWPRPVSGKGVSRAQSGEVPSQQSFRVRRRSDAIAKVVKIGRISGLFPHCIESGRVSQGIGGG